MQSGSLVISLDFELLWGVRDSKGDDYLPNIENTIEAIDAMLKLFNAYQLKATFATVGMLFNTNAQEWSKNSPMKEDWPSYDDAILSPYLEQNIEQKLTEHPNLYFAPEMIHKIREAGHEIGTHTYSHFYTLESGQNVNQFQSDMQAAVSIAKEKGMPLSSIVFPRDQVNPNYFEVLEQLGICNYRGLPDHWIYQFTDKSSKDAFWRRALRGIDYYLPLSGDLCTMPIFTGKRCNIPASMFLRPIQSGPRMLEPLRLKRIKYSMTQAAKSKKIFHLWWHPHNFGIRIRENIEMLKKIGEHFQYLQQKYDYKAFTMMDASKYYYE